MSSARAVLAPVVVSVAAVLGASGDQAPATADVRDVLERQLGFDATQVATVRRGQAVVVAVPPRVDREIAVAGAVRIDA